MDLVIKNGKIVTASETYMADIAVKAGKVVMIGSDLDTADAAKVIDAKGKYILPGAIDAHTHFELPMGATFSADNCETGSRAAACGGVTMFIDYAAQEKGMTLIEAAKARRKTFEPQACIDFCFHMTVNEITPEVLAEFKDLVDYGMPSVKLFTAYKNMMVDDGVFVEALERSKEVGALVTVHAENQALIARRVEKLVTEGKTTAWHHYESRPEFVEAEADKRVIHWAKSVKAPIYIVHLATGEALEEVRKARQEGCEVYVETCPHYLNFNSNVYKREDGRYFVCSPPIKGEESRQALWQGVKNGDVSTVATDHCPFWTREKDWGAEDFTKIPNGCMGTENLYPYMLSEANKGNISFNRAVELCSTNVARIFGCYPEKGTIAAGCDADLVIYDPEKDFVISKDNMHSNVDYTIWEGIELKGYPVMTISRGNVVFENGNFVGKAGWGHFVKCKGRI